MSFSDISKSISNTSLDMPSKNDITKSNSYIFAPDGLILACPETNHESTSRRSSVYNINSIRRFSFDSLIKRFF